MKTVTFHQAWLPDGWQGPVSIEIDEGKIQAIRHADRQDQASAPAQTHNQFGLPGIANVHSHAFQFAFAGLSEYRTNDHDSFWTWRQQMYRFLETLTPDDIYRIGKQLYSLMRSVGYAAVGEFHYLHHQPGGQPYLHETAMADALIQAALDVNMKICLLPVLYQRGGFDNQPLEGGQARFGCGHDQFVSMIQKLASDWLDHPSVRLGVALHSLRAVSIESAQRTIQDVSQLLPGCPIHIHIAEQMQEVDDCLRVTGLRPISLLLENFDVGPRWCLVHATHMTHAECKAVAASGAVIGVCPTTEANLGDGVFMAENYLQAGGKLAIGSDSHISIDPCEELRLLEYAQRLTLRKRAVLCTHAESCGTLLYRWATEGAAQALGFGQGQLLTDAPDLINIVDKSGLPDVPLDRLLDYLIFHAVPSRRSTLQSWT